MQVAMHTLPADTLVYDTALVARWQADPRFAYGRELLVPEQNVQEWILRWIRRGIRELFGYGSVGDYSEWLLFAFSVVVLLLLLWFVYKRRPGLFIRSRRNLLPHTVEGDTIYGVDFAQGIASALGRNDCREAVRLLYLQTLKELSDRGRIDWQPSKTPTEYVQEFRMGAFKELTRHFLRIRYGNFEATPELFQTICSLQAEVRKGGAS